MYSLASIRGPLGPIIVAQHNGSFYPLRELVPELRLRPEAGLIDLFGSWDLAHRMIVKSLAGVQRVSPMAAPQVGDFLPPVLRPTNIVCTGTNYYDHLLKDFKITGFDKAANDILFFTKQCGSLVGSGKSVRYPSQSREFDWEIELVAVIAKRGRRIPVDQAISYAGGYTIGLDLTARDLQFNKRQRRQFDLFGGKSFDDSAPTGPAIVPAEYVDPSDLSLKLWVNDELKQDSHTREMIWSIAEQIAEISQHLTLEPGDLLFTGSPAGVGYPSRTFLHPGDRIDAEISGLGRLSVQIVEDPDAPRVWSRPAL
jgi:2-keto-4-pentenoate hydratase/2-oxohepta-3-ene-1,7-dioic acid hydratase in catechol pathway